MVFTVGMFFDTVDRKYDRLSLAGLSGSPCMYSIYYKFVTIFVTRCEWHKMPR